MSYERSSSLRRYIEKRVRRLYPAYFVVIVLCALGLFFVSTKTAEDYFSASWLRYLLANLSFLNFFQHTLPGVFETNKAATINGALWTLKIEVMFYACVPLLVYLFRRFKPLPIMLGIYLLSIGYGLYFQSLYVQKNILIYQELARQLPGQLCYFIAGASFYYYLPIFERYAHRFILLVSIFILADQYGNDSFWLLVAIEPLVLATVVIFFGLFFYLGDFGKYGDFSYGVYIVHFPIIQCLISSGWFIDSPYLYLFTALILTAISAIALWHLIEKRFLLPSSHYLTVR